MGNCGLAAIYEKIKKKENYYIFEEYLTLHDYNNTFYAHT